MGQHELAVASPDQTKDDLKVLALPDIQELKRLAEAATPGEWIAFYARKYREWHVAVPISNGEFNVALFDNGCRTDRPEADSTFIAAANPQRILALVDHLDKLNTLHDAIKTYLHADSGAGLGNAYERARDGLQIALDALATIKANEQEAIKHVAAAPIVREDLAGSAETISDQRIAELICQHTGKRISLNVDEYYQHLEFARAIQAECAKVRHSAVQDLS